MDSEHDYYSILDVPRDASDADIRRAFRMLAKEYHPDSRGKSAEPSKRDFRLITEAYETLKDPSRRSAYDQELDEARHLESQASHSGKRSFAIGLSVGILLAIVAVGVVNYIGGAGRMGDEKTQDSLKDVMASEKAAGAGPQVSPERIELSETVAPQSLSSEVEKALPSPAPVQHVSAAPPIDATFTLPAEHLLPHVPEEPSRKSHDKGSKEPIEVVIGLAGRKKNPSNPAGQGAHAKLHRLPLLS